MDDGLGTQSLDFVLPHQNISYTPCYRNHTHHPTDWPLSGTLSIDKCERQCRFRACKAWSQTAAALRKHVNAHILNNKLDLRILPASNGREPLKISAVDDIIAGAANQDIFHQTPSLTSSLQPGVEIDSSYGSTASTVQPVAEEDSHSWAAFGKRTVPFSSALHIAPKRVHAGGTASGYSEATLGVDTRQKQIQLEPEKNINEMLVGAEQNLSSQQLDLIMAKAQSLRNSLTNSAKERSPFRQGSPLARSVTKARSLLDPAVEQHRSENLAARASSPLSLVIPDREHGKTISPKVIAMQFHENDHESQFSSPLSLVESNDPISYASQNPSPTETLRRRYNIQNGNRDPMAAWPPGSRPDFVKENQDRFTTQPNGSLTTIGTVFGEKPISRSASLDLPPIPRAWSPPWAPSGVGDVSPRVMHQKSMVPMRPPSEFSMQQQIEAMRQRQRMYNYLPMPIFHSEKAALTTRSTDNTNWNPTSPGEIFSQTLSSTASLEISKKYPKPQLFCLVCKKQVKTRSELKKHDLRHRKPFKCNVPGCPRTEGFSAMNDLERHTKSKHSILVDDGTPKLGYMCKVSGCTSSSKFWPRLDNFWSHLRRMHHMNIDKELLDDMLRRVERPIVVSDLSMSNYPAASQPPNDLLDLQPLHVLANSAVIGDLIHPWPLSKEQKVEG